MRIILADDHPIYRSGMVQLLQGVFADARIDEAGDAHALADLLAHRPAPDLILCDLLFPGFNYMRDLQQMRQSFTLCPIIVVSMLNDAREIDKIMALGMNGFISKAENSAKVLDAVHNVMQGQIVVYNSEATLSQGTGIGGLDPHAKLAVSELPPRQIEILKLLRHGMSNKEIARELDLSPFTVRSHVSALMKNLGVSNRAAASALAASYGLG